MPRSPSPRVASGVRTGCDRAPGPREHRPVGGELALRAPRPATPPGRLVVVAHSAPRILRAALEGGRERSVRVLRGTSRQTLVPSARLRRITDTFRQEADREPGRPRSWLVRLTSAAALACWEATPPGP